MGTQSSNELPGDGHLSKHVVEVPVVVLIEGTSLFCSFSGSIIHPERVGNASLPIYSPELLDSVGLRR